MYKPVIYDMSEKCSQIYKQLKDVGLIRVEEVLRFDQTRTEYWGDPIINYEYTFVFKVFYRGTWSKVIYENVVFVHDDLYNLTTQQEVFERCCYKMLNDEEFIKIRLKSELSSVATSTKTKRKM